MDVERPRACLGVDVHGSTSGFLPRGCGSSPIGRRRRMSASVLMTLIASAQSVSVASPDTVAEANLSGFEGCGENQVDDFGTYGVAEATMEHMW